MKTRVATIGVGIAVVLATALPSRSQGPEAGAKAATAAKRAKVDIAALEPPGDDLWQQKAQIELTILELQVEVKKAEIKRIESEHRIRRFVPTLAILTKLEAPITLRFPNETPLGDVLKAIKSATSAGPDDRGIPIYVDPTGLKAAEKTLSSTVTIDLDDVPAKVALRLICKQLGLAYRVQDGLLTISADESQHTPPTSLYAQ